MVPLGKTKVEPEPASSGRQKVAAYTPGRQPGDNVLAHVTDFSGEPALFGSVRFPGSRRPPSRWVSVSKQTDPDVLLEVLTDAWGLAPPSSVISMVGTPTTVEAAGIRRGILKAAAMTNAWIFTDGAADGVGSMATPGGEEGIRVPCIGIVAWEDVIEREVLATKPRGSVHLYAKSKSAQNAKSSRAKADSKVGSEMSHGGVLLEPGHTHFLMVRASEGNRTGARRWWRRGGVWCRGFGAGVWRRVGASRPHPTAPRHSPSAALPRLPFAAPLRPRPWRQFRPPPRCP